MRIQLPLETWMAIHDWIVRRELAAKVDKLWDSQLTPIAQHWLHEWQRNVLIGYLRVKKGASGRAELQDIHDKVLPIADVKMPDNICGFRKIAFWFLDTAMLEFLARMQPLFHNLSLECAFGPNPNARIARAPLLFDRLQPLINGPIELMEIDQYLIPTFTDYFPAAFFSTKLLLIWNMSVGVGCGAGVTIKQFVNWLFTPREDGQPRTAILEDAVDFADFNFIMTTVHQRFGDPERGQQDASPFFIRIGTDDEELMDRVEEATDENGPTGEQLTVKKLLVNTDEQRDYHHYFLVINCALNDDQRELREAQVLDWRSEGMGKHSTFDFI